MATQPRGDSRIVLSIDELKELNKHVVLETLTALGVDVKNPLEAQRDFQFIRSWRKATESVKSHCLLVSFGIIIAAVLGALWLGVRSMAR